MQPFDDMIPEEKELQQKGLTSLLQRIYTNATVGTPDEQEQIIERVHEKLLLISSGRKEGDVQVQMPTMIDTTATKQTPPPLNTHRIVQILNTFAAVLVVCALIGASLLLFSHQPQSIGAPSSTPVTVHTEAQGLEMSLSLTAGPYFLSEMLAVDVSLSNHSATTFAVGLPFITNLCGYTPGVMIIGGTAPYYALPIAMQHSCPGILNPTLLKPGQRLTLHRYVPVTSSGQVTLTAQANFFSTSADAQGNSVPLPSPLDGHWPSFHINVHPQAPSERTFSFRIAGSQVIANVPAKAQAHVVYAYDVSCQNAAGSEVNSTGNFGWDSLSRPEVNRPDCPARNVHWDFAFGIPGYAIVSGSSSSP